MANSSGNTIAQDPVARLAAFLRRGQSDIKVLTGKSKLSLTTVYLSILNRCFATTHPNDSSTEVMEGGKKYDAESVKYLRDILHRTVGLKLLHENATLKGAVDVSRFHALTVLEVKRVPVHFLVGLGSLRSQLRVLICSRCVHSLQMLLVGCGGDKAEEQDWPVLHTLNLSHNYIDALDESLRFLPALKALDLSHNNIRHTRDYFESLPEIIHLNLSFNQLTRVPSLGEFIPSHLQTLFLRGNSIESLSGVEYLEELEILDLAKNAIFDASDLFSLGYLHRLRKMHFDGNPFTFQSKWRLMIARYLAPEAAKIVTYIGDIPLTKAEIQIVPKKSIVKPMRPDYLSDNFSASLRSDMSYDLEESMDLEASQKKRKLRVKRLTAKVRNASISEQSEDKKQRARQWLSDAGAKSSSSPRSTPGTDAKKEFEDMRQMHGKDWLLALHNPYEPVSKPPVPSNQTAEPHDTTTNAKLGSLNHEDGTRRNVQVDVHVQRDGYAEGYGPAVVVEEVVERTSMPSEESAGVKSFDGVKGQVNGQEDKGVKQLERQASDEQFDLLMRQESQLQIRMNDGDLKEEDHEEEEDGGSDLCGPLLLRLHKTEPPVQLFVTVKEAFIEEKNLYGKVVQRLETKALKGMNVSIEGMLDEFSNAPVELPVVKLTFDYINKERRKREYVMDDMNTCESLIQVLEPIIVQNEASKTRVSLQCIKCTMEFPKDQAKKRVEKKPKKSSAWTSEEESGSDFDSVSEVLTCPSCGSNLLLEIDDPRKSEVNTPVGSWASFDVSAVPVAASSPWKQKRDTNAVIVSPSNKPNHSQDPLVDMFSSNSSDLSYTKSAFSTPSQLSPKKDRTRTNLSPAHGPKGQAIRDLMPSPTKDGSLTSSLSSQHSGTSSDFRLPDSSIKMEVSESSAAEELANYPREKLTELLTTNKSGFRQSTEQPSSAPQRYSLCPTDGGSVSSMDASGPPTPVQTITSNPFDSHFRNSSNTETKADPSRSSPSHLINGIAKTPADECNGGRANEKSNEVERRTNGGSDEVFNSREDHRYSEDDIVVLDNSEAASNHNMEYGNAFHMQDGYHGDYHPDKDTVSVDAISVGRLDSNESDIAVISETDVQSSNSALTMLRKSSLGNLSTTSDTVFENSHHLNISNKSSESPVQPRQETSSDDHRSLLSSNEHDAIYKSNSGSESAADVNGSGQWNASGTNRAAVKIKVQSSPSHSINSVTVETSMLSMAEEDCCSVHHRLKLFFSMSVFGNDEEFTCLLRGTVFQFSKKLSFDGLVVVSTQGIYIMKITREESENPCDWLAKKTQHPIKDLIRVHVGLGSQTMQFEFSSDGILYTIVIGDKKRTRQFAAVLMNLISTSAWKKKFKGVVWEHAQTFINLTDEVFVPQATGDTSYEVDPQINIFIISQLKTRTETKQGAEMTVEQVGIVVTATDIYLVEENHFYPLALGKNKKSVKGQQQFIPKGHRKISDISGLELYADSLTDVTVSFFSEDTGEESQWNISTTSDASMDQLLTTIKQPWKEMFGVDIQETEHPSIAIQDLT